MNSRELNRVSIGVSALQILIPRKITLRMLCGAVLCCRTVADMCRCVMLCCRIVTVVLRCVVELLPICAVVLRCVVELLPLCYVVS